MITFHQWKIEDVNKELLHRCKQTIENVVQDPMVVLYGSRARGDTHEYSDYDILVLVEEPVDMALKERLLSSIYPLELETGAMLTLLTYNIKIWESPLFRAMPFHRNVERDGVIL